MDATDTQASESLGNDNVDTENTGTRKKKKKSEKQKERVKQYKKKIRKYKRMREAEKLMHEISSSMSHIYDDIGAGMIGTEPEKEFINLHTLSERDETFSASGIYSALNASAKAFVPSTRMRSETEEKASSLGEKVDMENDSTLNTQEPKKKNKSEKQLERNRQYRTNKDGQIDEIVKYMGHIFDLSTPCMPETCSERILINPNPLLPRNAEEDIYSPRYSSNMLLPNAQMQPEKDFQDLVKAIGNTVQMESDDILKTSEPDKIHELEKERNRKGQCNLKKETKSAESRMDDIKRYGSDHISHVTPKMITDENGTVLISSTELPTRAVSLTSPGELSTLRDSSMFVSNTREKSGKNVQTRLKGFILLPSARNIPESLRTSASIFEPNESKFSGTNLSKNMKTESTRKGSGGNATTTQNSSSSNLKAHAHEFIQCSVPRQAATDQALKAPTDIYDPVTVKQQESDLVLKVPDDSFMPSNLGNSETDTFLKPSIDEFVPSEIRSVESKQTQADSTDTSFILRGSQCITELAAATRRPEPVSPSWPVTEIFSPGILEVYTDSNVHGKFNKASRNKNMVEFDCGYEYFTLSNLLK